METWAEYVKRTTKKAKAHLTEQAWRTYHGIKMAAERAGLRPGPITRAAEQRKTWFDIIRGL